MKPAIKAALGGAVLLFCTALDCWGQSASDADAVSLDGLAPETLILRVLDKNIRLQDINPSDSQIEKYAAGKTPQQVEEWKRQFRQSRLSGCLKPLFEAYIAQNNITASDAEVAQFNERMQQTLARQNKQNQKRLDSIQKELQADNLDADKRRYLTKQSEMLERILNSADSSQSLFQTRSPLTVQFIEQWKLGHKLYEQYGGRVIYQQAGPEPLDAYRKFLEDRQGQFEFFNKEAENLFWEYYRNDNMHTFVSDPVEAEKMMKTPWWLREPEEQDEADLWGGPADGLCIKVRPKKGAFYTNQTAVVLADLLHIGSRELFGAALPQCFDLEIDGRWYRWGGPQAADILSFPIKPKTVRYEFAALELTADWLDGSSPLQLNEGSHTVRLRYRPMPNPQTDSFPAPAVSNAAAFKILRPEPMVFITLEGPAEAVETISLWLAKNTRLARPVVGSRYTVGIKRRTAPLPQQSQSASPADAEVILGITDEAGRRLEKQENTLADFLRQQIPHCPPIKKAP